MQHLRTLGGLAMVPHAFSVVVAAPSPERARAISDRVERLPDIEVAAIAVNQAALLAFVRGLDPRAAVIDQRMPVGDLPGDVRVVLVGRGQGHVLLTDPDDLWLALLRE